MIGVGGAASKEPEIDIILVHEHWLKAVMAKDSWDRKYRDNEKRKVKRKTRAESDWPNNNNNVSAASNSST